MLATACLFALSLLLQFTSCSGCSSSLITITQLVPPGSSSLHKPPSLFNMTLPTYSLTLTGISLSCETPAGCGSLASITISHADQQLTLQRDLLQLYVSHNWTYGASFKLYMGPASPRYLALSIHFDSVSPVTVSSTLYGCEADREAVPTRQILQYDLIPAPSTPDPEYTGLVNNRLVSGGVGILTDQKTETTMTWHLAEEKEVSLLFRLDKNYSLTSVNILSPNHSSFELTRVRAELTDCEFTLQPSLLLESCAGSYFLLTVKSKHSSFSISEVELLTEQGQLSGKKYPISITSSNDSAIVLVFIVSFVTFLLTSILCIILAACAYACYCSRRGYQRWSFRSLNLQRRKGDYETMKMSSRSSDPAQPTPEKVDHDYCTLKIAGELEASLYVDMSSSVIPKPADTPSSPPPKPPPPKAVRAERNYMSMRIRAGSSAGSGPGGFLARLKQWGSRPQGAQLAEEGEVDTESAGDNAGTTKSLSRRGGFKVKSGSSHTSRPPPSPSRPPPPPARASSQPPAPADDAPVCEKEPTEISGEKEAAELKNSK